jgi:hypothetical protein
MRIKDNKIGNSKSLHKLNIKPEGCPMLIVEAESAFQVKLETRRSS